MIFDSHAHYDDRAFHNDREELLSSLPENGVGRVVNVTCDLASIETTRALTEKYPFIYGTVGIHPSDVGELEEGHMEKLRQAAAHEKVVAIGEIGLDYYWDTEPREVQKHWFSRQLALAVETGLPVVIHSREAAKDTLDMIKAEHGGRTGGVIHCYSGSKEMARDYLNMGFYLGVGGVITFKNSRVLKEVVEYMPLDRILVETDCPYLTPVPYRSKRNSSLYLPHVLEAIGAIKGITREEVEQATWDNAMRMYRIHG